MRMKLVLVILIIATSGLIITLISGLYEQNLSTLGLSRFGYGFPLTWYGHSWIVYPDMPVIYWFSWESFLLDFAFWSVIAASLTAVAMLMQSRLRKTNTQASLCKTVRESMRECVNKPLPIPTETATF